MEFKVGLSNTFIMNIFMIALALGMAIFIFFDFSARDGFFHYSYMLWLVIALIRLMNYRKYLSLMYYKKPILIVNESYIYDLAKEIKYYWRDIDTINVDNAYLYLKLYEPAAYFSKLNPVKKFFNNIKSNFHRTPFIINIDVVDVSQNALLEILDNFSLQAFATENQ